METLDIEPANKSGQHDFGDKEKCTERGKFLGAKRMAELVFAF